MPTAKLLREVYNRLYRCYGPQHWWPGETPFEVMVGAVLTQSVNWGNVERAIQNLKAAGALAPAALRSLPAEELAHLVRPAGFYQAKARKLKALARFLWEFGDDLDRLFALELPRLRERLLAVYGLGPESADSILLYAGRKPVFVIDAYTRRIAGRLGLASPAASYQALQKLFMENLSPEEGLFNEYHALLVRHGKETCRPTPRCPQCCLREICQYYIATPQVV